MENEEIKNEEIKNENVDVTNVETVENTVKDENKNDNEQNNESLSNIVLELKTQHDNEIRALKDAYSKEIAERDSVIKQLISGENTAGIHLSMVDKINQKRNFKKW